MEIMLAIVVVSAVIFFGALISMGNEHQRKAIDNLREQVSLWAIQDLKIKREHLTQTVQVSDPLAWLNKIASKVYGYDLQLQDIETYEEPQSLVCTSARGGIKVAFSPLSPLELRRIKRGRRNRLSQFADHNPLLSLSRSSEVHELSILNGGHLFDLELTQAWKSITKRDIGNAGRIWMYVVG